jgi:hypothetical protein
MMLLVRTRDLTRRDIERRDVNREDVNRKTSTVLEFFLAIISFITSDYLSSPWRIIRIRKVKHLMKMTFKRFKIRIPILNHLVVQINAPKSPHRELKERLLDPNHPSLPHLRPLRRRKMNQSLLPPRRNHPQVARRKRIRTPPIQHLVPVRLAFVLKRKPNITRNRAVQQTTMIFPRPFER